LDCKGSKLQKPSKKIANPAGSNSHATSGVRFGLLAGAGIIVIAVFLAYQQSTTGGFLLDDDLIMTENPNIKAADGLYRFWSTTKEQDYWPLTYSALWMEWRLWGRNPTGYHVTSLVLHILETLLIWIILRRMSIPGSFLAALIFAIHPVNVESVAWISEQKNTMAMLFFLLSILLYLKAGSPEVLTVGPGPLCYWLSLAMFAVAMLGKGSVAVLPVLLLGIVWWLRTVEKNGAYSPQHRHELENAQTSESPGAFFSQMKSDLLRTLPFFLIAVLLAAVNVWFQKRGNDVVFRTADFTERLLGAGFVAWFYLYEALFPIDLYFIYPMWHIQVGNYLWWLPLVATLTVTAVLWWYRKGWARPLLFAWGFFCVSLLPVAGFADVGFMRFSLVADRYQHIAIIGLITLVAAGWSVWRSRTRIVTYWAATAIAVLALGSLAFLTWRQNGIYTDEVTLYRATLKKNPECWMVHNNLGFLLGVNAKSPEKMDEAIFHFQQAVNLNPKYTEAQNNLKNMIAKKADALINQGNVSLQTGRFQEALESFEKVMRLKPDSAEVNFSLALAFANLHRSSEAIGAAQKALDLARSQGQTALAKKIEDWLKSYRAGLSGQHGATQPSKN
jgi:protein O-mannosyl-transferase